MRFANLFGKSAAGGWWLIHGWLCDRVKTMFTSGLIYVKMVFRVLHIFIQMVLKVLNKRMVNWDQEKTAWYLSKFEYKTKCPFVGWSLLQWYACKVLNTFVKMVLNKWIGLIGITTNIQLDISVMSIGLWYPFLSWPFWIGTQGTLRKG